MELTTSLENFKKWLNKFMDDKSMAIGQDGYL